MKELFMAYSRYNEKTNGIIWSHIMKMTKTDLDFSMDAYYPTILDTVFHVLRSDLKWLNRLSSFKSSPLPKDALDGFMVEGKPDTEKMIASLSAIYTQRSTVDSAIIELIQAISEEAFPLNKSIEFGTGSIERPLWQLLMQWFNHHTHHRGQVSLFLDCLGIKNDFSGVLDKIGG